jgi:AraC-like DNA-binding protein
LSYQKSLSDQQHSPEQPVGHTWTPAKEALLQLYDEMIGAIEQRQRYPHPDMNQDILTSMVGTNRKYLFQAVNQFGGHKLKQIINGYRVAKAKRMIEEKYRNKQPHHLQKLHQQVGLNSGPPSTGLSNCSPG